MPGMPVCDMPCCYAMNYLLSARMAMPIADREGLNESKHPGAEVGPSVV